MILRIALAVVLSIGFAAQADAQNRNRNNPVPEAPSNVNPDHERAKTEADSSYRQGDYARTEELTSNVLSENPQDHVAYYLRASARVEMGLAQRNAKLIRDGVADAREAIRYDGNVPMYYLPYLYGMSNLAIVEGRPSHAEVVVQVAESTLKRQSITGDDRANLLYQKANANKILKKYDAALNDLDQALRLSPQHLGIIIALGDIADLAGQKDKALANYNKAIQLFSTQALVYNNRGSFYLRQQKYSDAIKDFTKAIEVDPNYFYAYTNRGDALLKSGDPNAAEADFQASLKINPSQASVHNLIGLTKLARGDIQGAIADQNQVVRMIPSFGPAHADLGYAKFFAQDYRNASAAFAKALELDPKLRHVYPWNYWSLVLAGQPDEAKTFLATFPPSGGETKDWFDYVAQYLRGELTADQLLGSVHKTDPLAAKAQTCEAHFYIGMTKEQQGETKEAQQQFELAIGTGQAGLSAFRGAQFALKRMGVASNSTTSQAK